MKTLYSLGYNCKCGCVKITVGGSKLNFVAISGTGQIANYALPRAFLLKEFVISHSLPFQSSSLTLESHTELSFVFGGGGKLPCSYFLHQNILVSLSGLRSIMFNTSLFPFWHKKRHFVLLHSQRSNWTWPSPNNFAEPLVW